MIVNIIKILLLQLAVCAGVEALAESEVDFYSRLNSITDSAPGPAESAESPPAMANEISREPAADGEVKEKSEGAGSRDLDEFPKLLRESL